MKARGVRPDLVLTKTMYREMEKQQEQATAEHSSGALHDKGPPLLPNNSSTLNPLASSAR